MNTIFNQNARQMNLLTWLVAAAVLASAALLGVRASVAWLGLLVAGFGTLVLLRKPALGLPALVLAALVVPVEIGTGTDVKLNPASLLVPALLALWLLDMVRRRQLQIVPSPTNLPLALFLAAGLLSLLVGTATWSDAVPRSDNLLLVQLAQWAIFAFSAAAFLLAGNIIRDEAWLRRLASTFLIVGGGMAILRLVPGIGELVGQVTTIALTRAPFWMLLSAMAGGQLLFNRHLTSAWRVLLATVLLATTIYVFVEQRTSVSNWIGVATAFGVLVWLRFPRLRWLLLTLIIVLAAIGVLFPSIYSFAGGDKEWIGSGNSRMVLIQRVVEVTMRNPITGLGPAAYRFYAGMQPLAYLRAYWLEPQVNSHNNYVDVFAHFGILGLALLAWFVIAFARTGLRLRSRYREGFSAGYLSGALAAGAGALALMLFADWILPHVYNIGFPGFQASVLVWLFLGGVVALDNFDRTVKTNPEGLPEA